MLFLFAKPATTLSLLLITGLPAQDRFGVLVVGALLLSALGDTALLHDGRGFFLAGLLLFLLAHAAFTSAFLLGGGRGPWIPTGAGRAGGLRGGLDLAAAAALAGDRAGAARAGG